MNYVIYRYHKINVTVPASPLPTAGVLAGSAGGSNVGQSDRQRQSLSCDFHSPRLRPWSRMEISRAPAVGLHTRHVALMALRAVSVTWRSFVYIKKIWKEKKTNVNQFESTKLINQ